MPIKRAPEQYDESPFTEPHYSHSSIEMFCRCQMQWFFRYVQGEKLPPRGARIRGIAFHQAAQTAMEYKVSHDKNLSPNNVVSVAVSEFDALKKLAEWRKGEKPEDFRKETVGGVTVWSKDHAPKLKPIEGFVEHKFKVEFAEGFTPLVGIIDLVERPKSPVIVDHKTASRAWNPAEADRSWQMRAYALSYRQEMGKVERECRIDVTVCSAKKARVIPYRVQISAPDISRYLTMLGKVDTAIRHAKEVDCFLPAPPSAWWCSIDQCGYWPICPHGSKRTGKITSIPT
jgi:RecB family exonuclease